jgi:hypothetical protein
LENRISASRRLKLDPCLPLCANISSKWIKGLNVRPETLKLLLERKGNTLEHMVIGSKFLSRTLIVQQLRERIDKWDCVKLKSFCIAKETVTTLKEHLTRD